MTKRREAKLKLPRTEELIPNLINERVYKEVFSPSIALEYVDRVSPRRHKKTSFFHKFKNWIKSLF